MITDEADAAAADHRDGRAGLDLGGVDDRADAGRDAAADQAGDVERQLRRNHDGGRGGHDRVGRERADRQVLVRPAPSAELSRVVPSCSVLSVARLPEQTHCSPRRHCRHVPHGYHHDSTTWSPTATFVTPSPSASTTPRPRGRARAGTRPTTRRPRRAGRSGRRRSRRTRTSTSPGPGGASSRSVISRAWLGPLQDGGADGRHGGRSYRYSLWLRSQTSCRPSSVSHGSWAVIVSQCGRSRPARPPVATTGHGAAELGLDPPHEPVHLAGEAEHRARLHRRHRRLADRAWRASPGRPSPGAPRGCRARPSRSRRPARSRRRGTRRRPRRRRSSSTCRSRPRCTGRRGARAPRRSWRSGRGRPRAGCRSAPARRCARRGRSRSARCRRCAAARSSRDASASAPSSTARWR